MHGFCGIEVSIINQHENHLSNKRVTVQWLENASCLPAWAGNFLTRTLLFLAKHHIQYDWSNPKGESIVRPDHTMTTLFSLTTTILIYMRGSVARTRKLLERVRIKLEYQLCTIVYQIKIVPHSTGTVFNPFSINLNHVDHTIHVAWPIPSHANEYTNERPGFTHFMTIRDARKITKLFGAIISVSSKLQMGHSKTLPNFFLFIPHHAHALVAQRLLTRKVFG